ncbi:leucine-rich repeat receptor-like serine/threonine-protein kinase BAM1 [Triticum urartu]|nr:leucine-rich repeat receptor-like serine/threonine-protein kinase BAM1 [Triticum urartu]
MNVMANSHLVHSTILHNLSLVLLICLLLGYNCEAMSRKAEKAALLSLARHWDIKWRRSIVDRGHCNWEGISCTQEGFVEGISLSFYNLAKPIPSEICSFKNLTYINLSSNKIPGSFPTVLFSCSSLEFLDISYNSSVGSLPLNIHLLSKTIAHLNLESNSLSSSIPSSIIQLSSLEVLKLSFNPFDSHRIDPQLGNLTNLEELSMSSMNIVGEIPDTIAKLTRLRTLDLSSNTLNGTIPTGIWSMQNLEFLDLHSNSLSGRIPDDFCKLKNLSQLRTLDLSSNTLNGTIPSGIWRMQNMKLLDLHNNYLSGHIPDDPRELKNLSPLTTLDLSSNTLNGTIPTVIWRMKNLERLDLHNNSLSGRIQDDFFKLKNLFHLLLNENLLCGPLPENVTQLQLTSIFLDFSSNELMGKLPSPFEISRFEQSFLSNPGLCSSNHFGNLPPCTRLHLKMLVIIILVFGSAILICTGLIGLTKIKAFFSKEKDDAPSPQWKLTAFQAIDYDIQDILCNLIDTNLVGSGGSGKVYKICLGNRNGGVIAVKQIWCSSGELEHDVLEKQFQAEIEILGSIRHANIAKLLGFISSSESKLLIYEYMEHGSLYEWLHQKDDPTSTTRRLLNWPIRMSIATDAARGLCYMHHGCSPAIAHRDVKSSNILLDPQFKAKIADFGLARALLKAGEPESVSAVVGSFGYIAPEFGSSRKMNEKVDVYSFGVVLVELVTGRRANGGGGYENLAQWAWRQFHQDEDIHLTNVIDADIRDPAYSREVQLVLKLGLICTGTNPSSRPSMKQVLQVLQR